MRFTPREVVDISLVFSGKSRAVDLLHQVARRSGVELQVVRGRVTESEARYEVRMKGLRERIEKAVRLCAERGARRRILESNGRAEPLKLVGEDHLDRSGRASETTHDRPEERHRSNPTFIQVAWSLLTSDENARRRSREPVDVAGFPSETD